ncbi:hypothetical protein LPJ56_001873 [Coemansia sp. RSA 2599]|nr:hypothetical protein LPJ56_001873 [Coemansia sp. RSA 2599]
MEGTPAPRQPMACAMLGQARSTRIFCAQNKNPFADAWRAAARPGDAAIRRLDADLGKSAGAGPPSPPEPEPEPEPPALRVSAKARPEPKPKP